MARVKLTTALWYTPSGRSINRPRRPTTASDEEDDSAVRRTPPSRDPHSRPMQGARCSAAAASYRTSRSRPASPRRRTRRCRRRSAQVPQFRDAMVDYALALKASKSITSPDFVVTPAMRDELYRRMQVARRHGGSRRLRFRVGPRLARAGGADHALRVRHAGGVRARPARGRDAGESARAVARRRHAEAIYCNAPVDRSCERSASADRSSFQDRSGRSFTVMA